MCIRPNFLNSLKKRPFCLQACMSCCFPPDLESDPKHYSFEYDDDVDYDKEAQEMFQKFMSNTKVETSAMSDLGMDKVTKKFKDPRPKMEQRHQIVSYLFVIATECTQGLPLLVKGRN